MNQGEASPPAKPSSGRARWIAVIAALASLALIVVLLQLGGDGGGPDTSAGPTSGESPSTPAVPSSGSPTASPSEGTPGAPAPTGGATQPGSPPIGKPPTSVGSGRIGYLGCSQTTAAVEGYFDVGGKRFWPVIEYGGGAVMRWANTIGGGDARLWSRFIDAYDREPVGVLWWQLCILSGGPDQNYEAALQVLAEVRRLTSKGIDIFVSAQNGYVAPHVCEMGPANGPDIAQAVADRLVAEAGLGRGPKVSDLRGPDSAGSGPNQLEDSCHPNEAGKKVLGRDLLDFFG